jgi:hypothetical protein
MRIGRGFDFKQTFNYAVKESSAYESGDTMTVAAKTVETAERITQNKNTHQMKQESDVQFLEYVVKALVDNPNDVKIVRTVDEMGVLLTLSLNSADMGKIIGRMGNTAKAIRTLLRVVGMKNNARVNLKINEPEGGAPREMKTTKTVDEAMEDLKI